ncbi:MAG: toll/interleukin-1 receptor domain-containing protein [Gammaproteobacteria bacterium]|mgnify:FL=1|nr:toll/interleukin-1 receptor domain-containing protein [Gammaproteobacteria bacterium]
MKLFLSYASENGDIAEKIHLALVGAGHTVFYDRSNLNPGNNYNQQLRESIDAAEGMVFLISPQSVKEGRYTLTELKFARQKWAHPKNRVIPVLVEATPVEAIPAYLSAVTILEPEGNIAAEVSEAVARLHGRNAFSTGSSGLLHQLKGSLILILTGILMSLVLGTLFSLVYPRVEIDFSLAILFLIVGVLIASTIRGLWRAVWHDRR